MTVYDELNSVNSADETGLFPALQEYRSKRDLDSLKKLCVEMADFCKAIFASTQNEEQRKAYRDLLSSTIL